MSTASGEIGTLIIGAGVGGLSLGMFLAGSDFLILEQEQNTGGYLKQVRSGDFSFDVGVKCIHASCPEVSLFVEEVLGGENLDRGYVRSRFLHQGQLYELPRSVNAVRPFGERPDFRSYALRTCGEWAEDFLIPYAEKTWTAPASEIDYRAAIGKSVPPGHYLYPRGGLQEFTNRMAQLLGDRVRLNTQVIKVDHAARTVTLAGGETLRYRCLVSTVPLPCFVGMIEGVPPEVARAGDKLDFNSMATLAVELEGKTGVDCHYVLVPERRYPFRRLSFPRNFNSHLVPPGRDSILAEINLPRRNPYLACDAERRGEFIQAVLRQIVDTGLTRGCEVMDVNLTFVKLAHIVPDFSWRTSLDTIERFLESQDIHTCGRFAEWRYMNIDETIVEARAIAADIKEGHSRALTAANRACSRAAGRPPAGSINR